MFKNNNYIRSACAFGQSCHRHCWITSCTNDGNEYLIVLCDYFTKWSEAYPVPNHTALTVVNEYISRFGVPKQIHSDQGREFESELFLVLCVKLGIQKTRTTTYRPQSYGLVERNNRTFQQMLVRYANEHRNNWDENVPHRIQMYCSREYWLFPQSPHVWP